jgi:hypothetical protein
MAGCLPSRPAAPRDPGGLLRPGGLSRPLPAPSTGPLALALAPWPQDTRGAGDIRDPRYPGPVRSLRKSRTHATSRRSRGVTVRFGDLRIVTT